jgi:hypothetical protein
VWWGRVNYIMLWERLNFLAYFFLTSFWGSIVGIEIGYGLDDRGVGVRVPLGSRIFSSPRRPDRLWDPPSLLSNGYGDSILGGKAAGA